jgi:hypothetical protein
MGTQPSYLIPINFSLTERAKNQIRTVLEHCRAEKSTDPVAAVSWATSLKDPEGSWHEVSEPCLGIFERDQLPKDAIQSIDGIELVFNVPPDRVPIFEGQLLDYSEEKGLHFAVSDDGSPLLRHI